MVKLTLIVAILFSFSLSQAHDNNEETETQQEMRMIKEEIHNYFEEAQPYQKTLVDGTAAAANNCGYVAKLSNIVEQINYALQHYSSLANRKVSNLFFDPSVEVNAAYMLTQEDRLNSLNSAIEIHKHNYVCQ